MEADSLGRVAPEALRLIFAAAVMRSVVKGDEGVLGIPKVVRADLCIDRETLGRNPIFGLDP